MLFYVTSSGPGGGVFSNSPGGPGTSLRSFGSVGSSGPLFGPFIGLDVSVDLLSFYTYLLGSLGGGDTFGSIYLCLTRLTSLLSGSCGSSMSGVKSFGSSVLVLTFFVWTSAASSGASSGDFFLVLISVLFSYDLFAGSVALNLGAGTYGSVSFVPGSGPCAGTKVISVIGLLLCTTLSLTLSIVGIAV